MSDYSTVKFADLSPFYPTVLINGINGNLTAPIELQPRKRYRFRVISMSSSYWFKFRLPEHKMQIIEADGVYSEPSEVDGLTLGPGQRFSAIVTAHDTVAFNYIYNVTLFADFVPPALGLLPRYYSGSLRYNSDAPVKQLPAVSDEELIWNNIVKMQALDKQLLLPVDRQIVLTVRSYIPEFGIPYYSFSDFAFNQTLVPTLFTALSMGDLAFNSSVYSPLAQAHVVQNGEAVELLVNNPTTKDHALHLHMQNFQVVETGPFGDAVANGKPIVPHQTAGPWPMRCDTVTISPFSFLKLRFRVTRGAVMNFHCHNSNHNFHGLAAVVIAAPDLLQKHVKVPKSVLRMCELQSIKTSGNAAGNQGFNMTGLPAPLLVDRS
ncbi:hypothetical protein H4S02_001300 [Coemansia sp. RSA 2611]|nr:hypothetical protein H4S02_001300 [Coemansia sp. RSA 2611]